MKTGGRESGSATVEGLQRSRRVKLSEHGWEVGEVRLSLTLVGKQCPSESACRGLYLTVREAWEARGPFVGEPSPSEVLALEMTARGARPPRGQGLASYWIDVHTAVSAAGVTKWGTWRALAQYVRRREGRQARR